MTECTLHSTIVFTFTTNINQLTSYNANAGYAYSGQAGKIGLLGAKLATLPCMDDGVGGCILLALEQIDVNLLVM